MYLSDFVITGMWGFLFQTLIWIRENPLTFLTGLMTFVTALYARATTRYVQIVADQFAAQIAPQLEITLEKGGWQGDSFFGTILITALRNTAVLKGGDLLLRCEHGNIRLADQLTDQFGHTLTQGQKLRIEVTMPFEHHSGSPHLRSPSVECSVAYSDVRDFAGYVCEMLSGGVIRTYRQKNLGRLRLWLLTGLRRLSRRLWLWEMKRRVKEFARRSRQV